MRNHLAGHLLLSPSPPVSVAKVPSGCCSYTTKLIVASTSKGKKHFLLESNCSRSHASAELQIKAVIEEEERKRVLKFI